MSRPYFQKSTVFFRKHKGSISVIALNAALTLVMFWWLRADFRYFGQNYLVRSADSYLNGWALQQAFENLLSRPINLGYSEIFYPDQNSFAYTIASYGVAIQMLPFYVFSQNIFLTNNLYMFLTYPLTAWATFLFIRTLFKSRWHVAALVSVMVTFAPFRVLHLSHYETSSTHLLIFTLYFLHRLIDEKKVRWACGFAVAFFLSFQASGYLGFFAFILTLIILGYYLVRYHSKMSRKLVFNLLLAFSLTILLNAPFVLYKLETPSFVNGVNIHEIIGRSAIVNDWFAGSSWLGAMLTTKYNKPLWIGVVPVILSFVAILNGKHLDRINNDLDEGEHAFTHKDIVLLYSMIIILGYLLTLGPRIEVAETNILFDSPYRFLLNMPGFSQLRAPRRFIFFPIIGTAVLSAYSLKLLYLKMKRHSNAKPTYALLLFVITSLLFLEFIPQSGKKDLLSEPFPAPGPVYNWLSELPSETPIVHIPSKKWGMVQVLQHQSIHHQPTINGIGSFFPEWYPASWHDKGDPADILSPKGLALIQAHGGKYILVHRPLMSDSEVLAFETVIAQLKTSGDTLQFISSFDQVDVYSLPSPGD